MTAADPESSTVDIPTLQRQQQPEHTGTEIPICESQEHEQHQFVKSIGDLAALSAAINAFKRKYDDMQSHIQFIENAIDARLAGVNVGGGVGASSSSVLPPEIDLPENKPPQESGTVVPESSEMPEVKHLCESMSSKGLRKYILSNIAEPAKLMEEIPEALKLAKDPSKLVFESIGKFYLQGRRAYTKDSPMITSRKASLLAMECFLLMADPDAAKTMVENSTKVEAKKAAFAWRKRLMSEGGLANAQTMDARGLLLLIACFGVPSTFGDLDLDLLDLLRQSKPSEISNALRRSAFLVPRIPDLIDLGIKRKMHVDAVELVYAFGLEDKFSPPSILNSFLRIIKDAFEEAKQMARSPMTVKGAVERQLTALQSVFRCLEAHNLDPTKVLGGYLIKDEIVKLEKDIVELNKEIKEKERSFRMKEEAVLTQRLYNREMKRPRLSGTEMPMPASSYSPIYHDRNFPNHGDGDNISALVSTYLGTQSFHHRSLSSLRSSRETVDERGLERGVSAFESHTGNLLSNVYSPPMHGHSLSRQFSPAHRENLSLIGERSLSGQHISPGLQRVLRHSPSVDHFAGLPRHSSHVNSPSD